jgi:hypothetical protein
MEEALAVAGQELLRFVGPATIEKINKPDPTPNTFGNEVEVCRRLRDTASQYNLKRKAAARNQSDARSLKVLTPATLLTPRTCPALRLWC